MEMEFTFVELSKGEIEGNHYNNVRLSDGIETMKVKNETGADEVLYQFKRGERVRCKFEISPKKEKAIVVLKHIDLIKK